MEVSSTSSVSSSSVRRGRRHSWPPNSSLAEEESDDNGGEKSPNVAAESVPSAAAKGVTRKFSYMVAVSSGQEQLVTSHDSGFAVNSSASGGIVDRLGTFENGPPPSSKAPRKSPILEDAGSSGAQSAGGHSVASARSARSTRSTKSQQVGTRSVFCLQTEKNVGRAFEQSMRSKFFKAKNATVTQPFAAKN